MAQSHKVRLGDGTVVTVDPDGLRAWLEDDGATVQVPGTQEWRSLREFVAEEESAARLARALVAPGAKPAPAPAPPPIVHVQALADEPATASTPWRREPEAVHETPIRLKPLDEPPPDTVPRAGKFEVEVEQERPHSRHDRLEGRLLHVVSTLGTFLSRCLDPLTSRLDRGRKAPDEPAAPRRRPPAPASGGGARPVRAPRTPLAPPVPAAQLPVIPFAASRETREPEDVYEGEEPPRLLPVLWRWAVRVALVGGLVAGGVAAALYWQTWFPRAAEVGETVFTEIDRRARSRERSEELQQALGEATGRLPHLAPETIGLVLSSSEGPLPDPPTVFQLANEAADRGLPVLAAAEAAELAALRGELLGHLRPPERSRLQDYERARATRAVFPFENEPALELVARGARAMPPPRLERLQALLGKSVAAGLRAPPATE